jgi:hypothetical protein
MRGRKKRAQQELRERLRREHNATLDTLSRDELVGLLADARRRLFAWTDTLDRQPMSDEAQRQLIAALAREEAAAELLEKTLRRRFTIQIANELHWIEA